MMKKRSREDIVREIGYDLYLQEVVVREVLDRFSDILIEEVVNHGEADIHHIFHIKNTQYKGFNAGKGEVKPHKRLRARLSAGLTKLFQHKDKNPEIEVTKDNWHDVFLSIKKRPKYFDENVVSGELSHDDILSSLMEDE